MKKFVAITVTSLMMTPLVFAKGGSHPMAGCGLGYVLFASKDNSRPAQIFAATTNGTSGNQTFGITSGTLGCTESGMIAKNKQAEVYAEVNLRQLSHDIAIGKGESLDAFSKIVGVKDAGQEKFCQLLKSNYAVLFPNASASSTDFLSRLDKMMSDHRDLLS